MNPIPSTNTLEQLPEFVAHVMSYLRRRISDYDLCRDIAQEAAARLLKQMDKGVELQNPKAWMFRIARNLAVDEIRRRTPASLGIEAQEWLGDSRGEATESPPVWKVGGHDLDRDEILTLLPQAFSRLSGETQRLLEARYRGQMSCQELAICFDSTERAVSQRLYRSRRFLRNLLIEEDAINTVKKEEKCL
jgi:RNA polymerase sigma factor (sigma-70 family)